MKVHGSNFRDARLVWEFTGAELKHFYSVSGEYFICNAIKWEFHRRHGVCRYVESTQVIKSIREAVPNRFKKTKMPNRNKVVEGWLLRKYKTADPRTDLIRAVPEDSVFKIVMYEFPQ